MAQMQHDFKGYTVQSARKVMESEVHITSQNIDSFCVFSASGRKRMKDVIKVFVFMAKNQTYQMMMSS